MYYDLITALINSVKIYESEFLLTDKNVLSFSKWLNERETNKAGKLREPTWVGKYQGRSADSVITSSLVHLYRYARLHAKAAIANSIFATPDEFIYLINLVANGPMTKTNLIKLNVHEKSVGMQIINRLILNGLAIQETMDGDKRSKIISITEKGTQALDLSMENIRNATKNVTAPLSHPEKMELIRLLTKLEQYHEQNMAVS